MFKVYSEHTTINYLQNLNYCRLKKSLNTPGLLNLKLKKKILITFFKLLYTG